MKKSLGRSAVVGGVLAALLAVGVSATASAAEPRLVKMKATDAMQYDVKTIQATPGESLKVTLTAVSAMAKAEMAHNFVLLAKGTNADSFAMEAAMARDNGYIPKGKAAAILAQTTFAGGGETVEVTFNAPKEPGEYMYICTFPGHYVGGMKGKLIVK
ncbi:MAG: plastocyanin/azurin family copper-binding protein [Thermoanaerobaculia bacterium]